MTSSANQTATRAREKSKWLGTIPLVVAESHDTIPIFSRRRGGERTDHLHDYERSHSEEFATYLEKIGVTLLIADFYKGYGIEAERKYIDAIRDFAPVLRKHHIKVGLYIGSTMAYETFLAEKPEAEEWLVPDYLGKPVIYADQTFRRRIYFMHPGYVEYMKRLMHIGVEEVGADEMDFDNTSMQAEPRIFQHPLAIEHFREYLRDTYTPAELKQRLGFSDVRYVLPPKPAALPNTVNDPLAQLWTDFRCHQLNTYYAMMQAEIEGANPGVVIATNPHSEISGRNTIWEQGVNYPGLLAHMDAAWSEEEDPAGVTAQGILVNRIRSFKNASILGKTLIVATAGPGGSTLQMAESLAFGRQCVGDMAGIMDEGSIPDDHLRYIRFFHDQFDYYRDVRNVADVAVLYSYASMAFNNDLPAVSFILFTQALIQAKVPFDIIFDEHLQGLSRYRALVLADQECLDDKQMDLIRHYVDQGGGVVATELTSLFSPGRQRRPDFGLADLFGVKALAAPGERGAERMLEIPPVQRQIGRGRVSYVAAIKPAIQKPPAAWMTSQYWKLPLNWEELIGQVRWAAGGKFAVEVDAPETLALVAELVEQKDQNRRIVHLLNYATVAGSVVTDVNVEVALPQSRQVRQVTLLSPDGGDATAAAHEVENDRVRFKVPRIQTYTLAIVQME